MSGLLWGLVVSGEEGGGDGDGDGGTRFRSGLVMWSIGRVAGGVEGVGC